MFAMWNTESGQLLLNALNSFPEARNAIVDAINRFCEENQCSI